MHLIPTFHNAHIYEILEMKTNQLHTNRMAWVLAFEMYFLLLLLFFSCNNNNKAYSYSCDCNFMVTCKLKCQLHHKMNEKVKQTMIFVIIIFAIDDSLLYRQNIYFSFQIEVKSVTVELYILLMIFSVFFFSVLQLDEI